MMETARVTYAVIGGAAIAVRGRVRGTRDLDLILHSQAGPEGMDRVKKLMSDAGFAHHPRADRHELDRVTLYRFWYPVSAAASTGVDVQVSRDALLDRAVDRATEVVLYSAALPVATAEDLVVLKLLSFRPIDRADAVEISLSATNFDPSYVERCASELGLLDRWQEVKEAKLLVSGHRPES
ncbi:MAG: hypothetical protein FJX76_07415 [Armatimonadetes bacterium]|nr:hypothetical protein [Armatimonadota bacterium]